MLICNEAQYVFTGASSGPVPLVGGINLSPLALLVLLQIAANVVRAVERAVMR